MKKLKKGTICFLLSLVLIVTSITIGPIITKAAGPFWGDGYCNPGSNSFTFTVDVTSSVIKYTVKTWDFSGGRTLGIDVYAPNGQLISKMPVLIGANQEITGCSFKAAGGSGTYKIVCSSIDGSAGGWVGVWIY